MIFKLPNLRFLDDRPVFPEDRRKAEAYMTGGIEAERAVAKQIKQEQHDARVANHEAFQLMIKTAREKKELEAE